MSRVALAAFTCWRSGAGVTVVGHSVSSLGHIAWLSRLSHVGGALVGAGVTVVGHGVFAGVIGRGVSTSVIHHRFRQDPDIIHSCLL